MPPPAPTLVWRHSPCRAHALFSVRQSHIDGRKDVPEILPAAATNSCPVGLPPGAGWRSARLAARLCRPFSAAAGAEPIRKSAIPSPASPATPRHCDNPCPSLLHTSLGRELCTGPGRSVSRSVRPPLLQLPARFAAPTLYLPLRRPGW